MERNICLNWPALVEEAIKRRKEQNLSQEKLAIIARVSKPTVSSFEQCRSNITLASALKILKILGLE